MGSFTKKEIAGWIALAGSMIFFLLVSWRKWPDPLIDFGRELFVPWQISQGALLYRDIDCYRGPLSQYFNALLFSLFKPSLTVLINANLIIFIIIVVVTYTLIRSAWGVFAAFISTFIFIAVFGCSQFVGIGNYNYITPYSHESTHGLLLCLASVFFLVYWIKKPTILLSFIIGIIFGLTALLKPEILLADLCLIVSAIVLRYRLHGLPTLSNVSTLAISAIVPSALFFVFFVIHLSPGDAFRGTAQALLSITTNRFTGDVIQTAFLGIDQPLVHLKTHLSATLFALCIFAGICVLAIMMMFRMILNGRIYHYGFYQAALAAIIIPAIVMGEVPSWFGIKKGRGIILACTTALVLTGTIDLTLKSIHILSLKTESVGSGSDKFFAFPANIYPSAGVINGVLGYLEKQTENRTLVVLPEGVMLNYLLRKPSVTPTMFYYAAGNNSESEKQIVDRLMLNPPDNTVLISRDLHEYGVARYGESENNGQLLLKWLSENNEIAQIIGGDPLDNRQFGALIFRKKENIATLPAGKYF